LIWRNAAHNANADKTQENGKEYTAIWDKLFIKFFLIGLQNLCWANRRRNSVLFQSIIDHLRAAALGAS
jgi:hypothetical protein